MEKWRHWLLNLLKPWNWWYWLYFMAILVILKHTYGVFLSFCIFWGHLVLFSQFRYEKIWQPWSQARSLKSVNHLFAFGRPWNSLHSARDEDPAGAAKTSHLKLKTRKDLPDNPGANPSKKLQILIYRYL
jgi:hypothetical protein